MTSESPSIIMGSLKSLVFERNDGHDDLKVTLLPTGVSTPTTVCLHCIGVSEVGFGNINSQCLWMISMISIRDRQLEGLHFQVREIEHDQLRLLCERYEVVMADPPQI